MFFSIPKIFLLSILILALALPNFSGFAQVVEECKTREECEALLKKYEEEIKKLEGVIGKTEQEKRTLQNQISNLRSKIKKLDLQIQQNNVMIKDLTLQIKDTEGSIEKTSLKIESSRQNLAHIISLIYEESQKTPIEILLSSDQLSDFFNNLVSLENLNYQSRELLVDIKALKSNLEEQKQSLDNEKGDLEKVLQIQTLQKQESQSIQKEQEYVLKLTETQYQQYLKEKEATQKKAAEIRARIFELIGVPKAPTFGEAYDIAKWVAGITGVRPAFLLAVLQQESAIGKNVGQCYLRDVSTGAGVFIVTGRNTQRVMGPTRDVPPFLQLTKELGRDPFNTPVSCPMSVGWGGAMGPAQFIPSTWMRYKDRLRGILQREPNPWSIQDAFLAAGLYLTDYGAATKTRQGEWQAAMIYFSGSTNSRFAWYADNVLKIAAGFQADIEIIERR